MSTQVPKSWAESALEDIAEIHDNLREPVNSTERKNRVGPYPYYGATGQVGWIDDYKQDGVYVLLGEDGAPFFDSTKDTAYLVSGKCWVNNHAHVLKGRDGICLDKYLLYALNQTDYRGYANGTTRLKLTQSAMRQIPINLAPLSEQERIVAKIETLFSELDKGIESLKTAREQLKVYHQALLKHAFEGKLTAKWREQNKDKLETPEQLLARIQQERQARYQKQLENWQANVNVWETNGKEGKKPGRPRLINALKISAERDFEVPAEWGLLELGTLAHESILGKMLDKAKNSGLARPYLGNINVRWGTFNLDNLKSMKIEESEVERYSLESGDIVICEGGEPGRCAVWQNTETPVFIQKALHRVRFTESYSSKFAFYYLTYSTPLERVVKHFTGTTIKHLTGTGLNKVQFPVCSLEEQIEIVDILEGKLSLIESLESEIYSQLKKSDTLRQSILKKAFSGQLVPQNPNDETASALLARIQAEKSAQATSKASHKNSPTKRGRKAHSKEAS
jgi:type I restriction enzyme S subunit